MRKYSFPWLGSSNRFLYIFIILFIVFVGSCRKDSLPPAVNTIEVTCITQTTAYCGGNITSDGGAKITERGLCWSNGNMPSVDDCRIVIETQEDEFTGTITGLSPFTTYWVRAYATNKQGTAYGEVKKFSTEKTPGPTVTDIDGNLYHSVTIGTQIWMLENLKVTHFRNGDSIPFVTSSISWPFAVPRVCVYNNDENYRAIYGCLYNWHAVNDSRGLAPQGWHIPSRTEWQILINYLGDFMCGGKLKEAGTEHWIYGNYGATNESGFTALPGGGRTYSGVFGGSGYGCNFWTSTAYIATGAYFRSIEYNSTQVMNYDGDKMYGMSIRCIKDN